MAKYYVLVKPKNAKSWSKALPFKRGVPLSVVRIAAKTQIKPGFTYRIISEIRFKKFLRAKQLKKKLIKRRKKILKTLKKRRRTMKK